MKLRLSFYTFLAEGDLSGERDFVDEVIEAWGRERPELDLEPVAVAGRIARAYEFIEAAIGPTLDEFGLSRASFDTLAVLRRSGPPYQLTVGELATRLMRSAGTLTTRIDRLVDAGLAARKPDPRDRRFMLVSLTDSGRKLTDAAASAHLANEARLLAVLTPKERGLLASLLRTLLATWERADAQATDSLGCAIPELGLVVLPARASLEMRRAVGLADRAGLLVHSVSAGSEAARVDIRRGDLLVRVDGAELDGPAQLRACLASQASGCVSLLVVRANEEFDAYVNVATTVSGLPSRE